MDSLSISQSILRSIEERRRRLKEAKGARREAARRGDALGEPALAACAGELARTIRSSIQSSFSGWQNDLVPQLEGLAQRPAGESGRGGPPAPGRAAPGTGADPLALLAEGGSAGLPPGKGASTGGDGLRAELRAEDRDPPSSRGLPPPPPPAGDEPADQDSWSMVLDAIRELREEWDRQSFDVSFPEGDEASSATPGAPPEGSSGASDSASPGGPAAAPAGEHPQRELAEKLDELIRLVQRSLDERGGASAVDPEVSRQIAREVAGRLRDTLAGHLKPERSPAPAPEERIPLDDVASIIDRITGPPPP